MIVFAALAVTMRFVSNVESSFRCAKSNELESASINLQLRSVMCGPPPGCIAQATATERDATPER